MLNPNEKNTAVIRIFRTSSFNLAIVLDMII